MLGCHDPRPTTLVICHPSITRYYWAHCHHPGHTLWGAQRLVALTTLDELPGSTPYTTHVLHILSNTLLGTLPSSSLYPCQEHKTRWLIQPLWASRAHTLQSLYSISPLMRFRARCYLPVTSLLRYTKLGGSYNPYQPRLTPSNPCIPYLLSHAIGYAAIL